MKTITITSKRQATLPAALCADLGVGPGDKLHLEQRTEEGETVWVLRALKPDWSWLGAARRYAGEASHDWTEIERSVGRGLAGEKP